MGDLSRGHEHTRIITLDPRGGRAGYHTSRISSTSHLYERNQCGYYGAQACERALILHTAPHMALRHVGLVRLRVPLQGTIAVPLQGALPPP